jgi:uncharacterized protein YjbI with pentapeptide repeats
MITKEDVLNNLEQVKKYISDAENKKEEKVIGITIRNRFTGSIIFQSTKTTYKEAIIEKGDADLSNANLRNANLSDADLSDADLSDADLSNANLRNADLSDASLRNANLSDADLSDADLRNANLRNANLRNSNLSDAELNCAKFYGRGGTQKLTKAQLPNFLNALGFQVE